METMGTFSGGASCQPVEMANLITMKWLVCWQEMDVIKYTVMSQLFPNSWQLTKKTNIEDI